MGTDKHHKINFVIPLAQHCTAGHSAIPRADKNIIGVSTEWPSYKVTVVESPHDQSVDYRIA